MASTKKQQVQQLLATAVAACEDKKAEDIRILALDPSESGLTDYFLLCTGMSDRQNVAITDEIELRLKREFATYPNSVEGRRQGDWVLMDYVDFIVHVFSAEKRAFYGLERLRKSATVLSIDDLNAEVKAAISAWRKKAAPVAARKATATATKATAKKAVTKKATAKKGAGASKRTIAPKKAASTSGNSRSSSTTKAPPGAAQTKPSRTAAPKKLAAKKTAAKKM